MFRPCIDLHEGKVKQIVGGTLDAGAQGLRTNYISERPAEWYARLYQRDGLRGGHVVMLGPRNESQARAALAAYPGGLQVWPNTLGNRNPANSTIGPGSGAGSVEKPSAAAVADQLAWA